MIIAGALLIICFYPLQLCGVISINDWGRGGEQLIRRISVFYESAFLKSKTTLSFVDNK